MVSADNLNLDVLELIFSYLSGHDLTSVALVSRSFFAGVIPMLYRTVAYRLREGKAYDSGQLKVQSPFAVILAHPHLGTHVQTIEVQTIPFISRVKVRRQPHPVFMRECTKAISLCRNLRNFKCIVPNVLPAFLMSLQNKPRLSAIRVYGDLTAEQTRLLTNLTGELESLVLEFGSWNLVDALPRWAESLQRSLTSVTLFMTNELNDITLEAVLKQLPELQGLHVVGCPRVDHIAVLRMVALTPMLESLSFTTTESTCPITSPPAYLPALRHLSLDTRYNLSPSPAPTILLSILEHLKSTSCQLSSFCLKLPERKLIIGHQFIVKLVYTYGAALKRLAFIDCGLELDSVAKISKDCPQLERLDMAVPMKDIYAFAAYLSHTRSLTTLVDIESHMAHGIRPSLNQDNVEFIMENVESLKTVVSERRVWVGHRVVPGLVTVKLERRLPYRPRSLWFLPTGSAR